MKMYITKTITFNYPLEKCNIKYNSKHRFDFYTVDDLGVEKYFYTFNEYVPNSDIDIAVKIANNHVSMSNLIDDKKTFKKCTNGDLLEVNRY
tara:strand:- start:425 stop:700 length:276 start_codon:yes stop_codon:yes gene_type:complete